MPWAVNSPCTRSNASEHSAATTPELEPALEELPLELEADVPLFPLLLPPTTPLRCRCFLVLKFSPSPFVLLSLPLMLPTAPVPVPDTGPNLDPVVVVFAKPPPRILRRGSNSKTLL